jgi:23S rRNA (guanosine2251-2'-O)-methyltransferase
MLDELRHRGEDYCWGRNGVISLLEESPAHCLKVMISKTMQGSASGKIVELCRVAHVPYVFTSMRALDSMLDGENHQGVAAMLTQSELLSLESAMGLLPPPPEPALVVMLDHIQDPHNLGAIIRSSEAASASFIALPRRRGSLPTGTVVKTSAGASLRFPLASVGNVANAVRDIQDGGLWAVGLDAEAPGTIYDTPLPKRCLLVVGSEGSGLGRTTQKACDETLRIPIRGGTGSLNASIALSITMFEWSRINL